jgi:hypothetical protein
MGWPAGAGAEAGGGECGARKTKAPEGALKEHLIFIDAFYKCSNCRDVSSVLSQSTVSVPRVPLL